MALYEELMKRQKKKKEFFVCVFVMDSRLAPKLLTFVVCLQLIYGSI